MALRAHFLIPFLKPFIYDPPFSQVGTASYFMEKSQPLQYEPPHLTVLLTNISLYIILFCHFRLRLASASAHC